MEQLIGLPTGIFDLGLAVAMAALLAGFALLAWRATILFKLGTRNIPRRRVRAGLIVFGLTLSTAVIGSALGTGDTMTRTVRSLITDSLGPVDEVVVVNPPRNTYSQNVRSLTEPGFAGLAAANLNSFEIQRYQRLQDLAASSDAIGAITPAVMDQVTAVHPESQQLLTTLALVAMPGNYPDAFGQLKALDGTPISLAALGPDELVINEAAAILFGAVQDQPLQIRTRGQVWDARIRVIVKNGGLGGMQPVLIAPLERYQKIVHLEGRANAFLVANEGGVNSVARTEAASRTLRALLADRTSARRLKDYLARPEVQRAMLDAESEADGRDRERLAALRTEAALPEMSDRFISLITDPAMRAELYRLGQSAGGGSGRRALFGLLSNVSSLSVLEVKQEALDRANEYGAVVTTIFLVLGIFSFAAGILLVFLIFALLAADRSAELATMRALGMTRRQIIGMFLFEGLFYDLLGALLGGLMGIVAAYFTVRSLARALEMFGFSLVWHVEPRSLAMAFAVGVLLSFVTMVFSAWRASHTGIVSATQGEAVDESRGWLIGVGVLVMLMGGVVWWRWHEPAFFYLPRHPLVLPGALSLGLLGLALGVTGVAGVTSRSLPWSEARRLEAVGSGFATLAGFAIAGLWIRALLRLPTPRGDILADSITIAVGGVVLILAVAWAATRALGPLLGLADRGLTAFGHIRAVVRPAAGYLGAQRWRTGMAVLMFGMVIFIMVTALTMINALLNAYAADEPPIAGFELRATQRGNPNPVVDMRQELSEAPAISAGDFRAVGRITSQDVQIVQLGAPRSNWQTASLIGVDDGFLGGIQARLERLAPGYDTTGGWAALRAQPGNVIVSSAVYNRALTPTTTSGSTFRPITIWARPSDDGQPIKLTVIGVIDSRSDLDTGIYASEQTALGMGLPLPPTSSFVFAVSPGIQPMDAAEGLRISFSERGLTIINLGDKLRIAQSVRMLLTRLVQGFMGLGLVAGIAALGMLGVQSVIERRTQLGTLRALGFTRWQTRATLAVESGVIAALGITLGIGLGLMMARSLVALLSREYPEILYAIPWDQVALTATTAWLGSALAVALAVWQAGRVSPADALRSG